MTTGSDPYSIEIGWSPRSSRHVILHHQPPKPSGLPFYVQATACGRWLHGLMGSQWVTPEEALGAYLDCKGCRRYVKETTTDA